MGYMLYSFFRSSASYRVRIALNLKGIDYALTGVHLRNGDQRAPEFLRLNPQGLVPVLEHEGRYIPQSLAIIEYLDELIPSPPLLPDDPYRRSIARAMAQVVACDLHPLCNLRVLDYLRGPLAADPAAVAGWYRHWVALGLEGLEGLVADHGGSGPFCLGSAISLADICLVPQLYNARRFDCDVTAYKRLVAIDTALESHPAFIAAQPERQPDAVPG